MDFRAIEHGVNVIAFKKNNTNYAMCCAWAMMTDYDKILALLGEQSVTGKACKKGDIVGFCALEKNQKDVAIKVGENHSDSYDKLMGISYYNDGAAILIDNAKTQVVCEVIDVLHLEGIEGDNLLYLKMIRKNENEGEFLHMGDF